MCETICTVLPLFLSCGHVEEVAFYHQPGFDITSMINEAKKQRCAECQLVDTIIPLGDVSIPDWAKGCRVA